MAPSTSSARRGRHYALRLAPLVCMLYLVVSGGAYGIEDAVRIAGPRLTLLLCLVVPLMLSVPTSLMAAELTALMPVEGGFYVWVKRGVGEFAGFAEAYLTMLFTLADSALYPVLFATYLADLLPLRSGGQIILAISLVWTCGLLNLIGLRTVGRTSVAFTVALLLPLMVLVGCGLPRLLHWELPSPPLIGAHFMNALAGGLVVILWNFGGWENLSVAAEEIDAPRVTYRRALAIAVPMVVLGYLLPLAVTLAGATSTATWHTGSLAAEGLKIGGPMLGAAIAIGGIISAFAMFEAALMWVSRLPFVLARDGYLPPRLSVLWERTAVPAGSIIVCCAVFTLLVPLGFLTLLTFDVFFYMMALALEMWALVRLRTRCSRRDGLFMIGGGRAGLYAVVAAPMLTWIGTFGLVSTGTGAIELASCVALAFSTWPAYRFLRRRYGGPRPTMDHAGGL
ncbi:MAG TPA: APC family permease [Candidatus Binataceae bacterium]|nr:APC family permease [Candidatus Binataceae bacterium]